MLYKLIKMVSFMVTYMKDVLVWSSKYVTSSIWLPTFPHQLLFKHMIIIFFIFFHVREQLDHVDDHS